MLKATQLCRPAQHNNYQFSTQKQYYCGCGIIFFSKQNFKRHVKAQHDPYFIEGSSHYLKETTEIVLPARYWNPTMMKDFVVTQTEVENKAYIEINTQSPQEEQKQGMVVTRSRKPRPNIHQNSIKEKPHEREGQQSVVVKRRGRSNNAKMSHKIVQWNGFILEPNKRSQHDSYYCGKCRKSFNTPDQYVPHCFEECKQIEHNQSSHYLRFQENQSKGNTIENNKQSNREREHKRSIKNNKYKNFILRNPFLKQITFDIPKEKESLYEYLSNDISNTSILFTCGCGKVISSTKRSVFIQSWGKHNRIHEQILPDNSSHIFLQKVKTSGGGYKYACLEVNAIDDGNPWFCPCRPKTIMNRQTFINHVRFIHKGITPAYKLEDFMPQE